MKRVVTLACLCLASFICEISPAPSSGQLQIREVDAEVIGKLRVAKGGDALLFRYEQWGASSRFS